MMAEAGPIGRSLKRLEDGRLLLGKGQVIEDLHPEVTRFDGAMAAGGPLVDDAVPGNLYFVGRRSFGDVGSAFAEADLVVEGEVTHPRVSAAPIEGRGAIAMPDGAGGVVVWSSTQVPHLAADAIAETLMLNAAHPRVVAADVRGAFCHKAPGSPAEIPLARIPRRMGQTVQ